VAVRGGVGVVAVACAARRAPLAAVSWTGVVEGEGVLNGDGVDVRTAGVAEDEGVTVACAGAAAAIVGRSAGEVASAAVAELRLSRDALAGSAGRSSADREAAREYSSTSAVAVSSTGGSGTPHPRSARLERRKRDHQTWAAFPPLVRPRSGRNIGLL
jgi:hypothetical protein